MAENDKKVEVINQLKDMGFDQETIDSAMKICTEDATIEQVIAAMEQLQDGQVGESDDKTKEQQTPESLEARRLAIEAKIIQRRKEREEEEKRLELEREMKRRKDGIEMGKTREEIENRERIRVAEEIRREKMEAKAAKEAVLKEIERDRLERKARDQTLGGGQTTAATAATTPIPSSASATNHNKCVIAIKLLDGSQVQQEFDAKESLAAVKTFAMIKGNVPGHQQVLLSVPPLPPFSEEDMFKPLSVLGLCPRARLMMRCKDIKTL